MSRRSCVFAAMIVSPVRWYVANCVPVGSIFGVCDLRRRLICWRRGSTVCCFCLASKNLALLREVDALKEEVKKL